MSEILDIDTLFSAGAHFGYSRARRHPTAAPFLFATKDQTDFFNLEETAKCLDKATAFVSSVSGAGGQVLFVSGKNESQAIVKAAAERIGVPYCAGRWIGGTLTNFKNIRKRIDRLQKLEAERETGALEKYTKRERLLLDREIEGLRARFAVWGQHAGLWRSPGCHPRQDVLRTPLRSLWPDLPGPLPKPTNHHLPGAPPEARSTRREATWIPSQCLPAKRK